MPIDVGGYKIDSNSRGLLYPIPILLDGLALYLDVSNYNSYPDTGTQWYDLAQGLVFDSLGTQTPLETKSGARSLAFNGLGYWECSVGYDKVDMAGACTLIMWIYAEGLTERDTIFEKAGTTYASYQQEIAVTYEANESLSWYSRYNNYDYANTANQSVFMDINSWNMMAIKMSTGKIEGTARSGYFSKNGGNWVTEYTVRSTTAITPSTSIRVGYGYAGAVENGNIGMVAVYNRELNNTEILSIYNNTKTTYGL